jgi:hypothetical protein
MLLQLLVLLLKKRDLMSNGLYMMTYCLEQYNNKYNAAQLTQITAASVHAYSSQQ